MKWPVKVLVGHPDAQRVPSYSDWESRTQKAVFDTQPHPRGTWLGSDFRCRIAWLTKALADRWPAGSRPGGEFRIPPASLFDTEPAACSAARL